MRRTTSHERERGIALAMVLFVMLLMLGIGAALHTSVLTDTSARGATLRATSGFYAAEAGINRGMGDYRNIFLNWNVPTGADFNPHSFTVDSRNVTYQLSNIVGNPFTVVIPAGQPFAGLNSSEYRYTANSISQMTAGDTEASIGTQFNVDWIPIFQFLAFFQGDLEILPGANAVFHGPIHTNGDLYINSDATLSIADCLTTGPNPCQAPIPFVHMSTAKDVYRGRKDRAECHGTVNVSALVDTDNNGVLNVQAMNCTSATQTTKQTSTDLSSWLGAITAHQPTVSVPAPGVLTRITGDYWKAADLRIVLNIDNKDATTRMIPFEVQNIDGSINAASTALLKNFMGAYPSRLFYNDVPTATNTTTTCFTPGNATFSSGGTYCEAGSYNPTFTRNGDVYACPQSLLGSPALYTGCGAYIQNVDFTGGRRTARRGGFYNNREHAWVYMLNLNVHDLLAWNRAQPVGGQLFAPNVAVNGGVVIYLSVQGPNSGVTCTQSPAACPTPRYGVRVFGSPNLDFDAAGRGLTVISDVGIYIEGEYNTGGNTCSYGGAGSCPWKPAAFMGDTINVLSNNWSGNSAMSGAAFKNDAQTYQPLNSRPGTSTNLYAAFIAGVDVTVANQYNGGLENYPRMHENWAGTLTYRGSFVSLGVPVHANGIWCGTGGSCTIGGGCGVVGSCNIYNPPVRNWDYDTNFQNVTNLPPLTPRFVTVQQILFTENFR